MKKIILIIIMLASVGGGMQAQDTLWQRPAPLGNYFSNHWIDTTNTYNAIRRWSPNASVLARQFVTEDTLQIYGIAAMMVDDSTFLSFYGATGPQIHSRWLSQQFSDMTLDNCWESLLLFQYHGPDSTAMMQQLGDSLPVHPVYTQPTHYMMSYRQPPANIYFDTAAKPIYERYFSTPQTVHDTFFAGFTQGDYRYNRKEERWEAYRPGFFPLAFDHTMQALYLAYEDESAVLLLDTSGSTSWWFSRSLNTSAYYIFPILTPEPAIDTTVNPGIDTTSTGDTVIIGGDTVIVGGDTIAMGDTIVVTDTVIVGGDTIVTTDTILSIMPPDLLQRLTGVTPNPARGTARVVASMGLTMVEAYNLAGRKVHTQRVPQGALSVTLDVSRWPAGTYLLRIHTPMGATIKKLTVAR